MMGAGASLLRVRHGHDHTRVTYVELFFDLVFVFAITQLSHTLLEHLSLKGLLQTTLLLMAVWWVWITPPGSPTGWTPTRRLSACCCSP